jgi:hypothetical protein
MSVSLRELTGLFIGALLGASPFLLIWWFYGRGAPPFDSASWMFGIPAIVYAPFGALLGAIIGVAIAGRK